MKTTERNYTSTQLCKQLGFASAKALHLFLQKKGVVKRAVGRWVLTKMYAGKNLASTNVYDYSGNGSRFSVTMKWTEKGKEFLKEMCNG